MNQTSLCKFHLFNNGWDKIVDWQAQMCLFCSITFRVVIIPLGPYSGLEVGVEAAFLWSIKEDVVYGQEEMFVF